MRGVERQVDGDAAGARARVPRRRAACATPEARCAQCHGAGSVRSARGHMVFSKPCAACGGTGRQRAAALRGLRRAAGAQCAPRRSPVSVPPGVADGARLRIAEQGPRRPAAAARPAISTSPCRSRRIRCSAATATTCICDGAGRGARSGARRADRGAVARRPGAAASAAGHAVGPAVPRARARRPAARRAARRSGRRSAAGAAARCSTSDRRNCCASSARLNADGRPEDAER